MKPVAPIIPNIEMSTVMVAENQEEYQTLPVAFCAEDEQPEMIAVCRWHMEPEDREKFLESGDVWIYIWTGGRLFNPMLLSTEPPIIEIYTGEGDKI